MHAFEKRTATISNPLNDVYELTQQQRYIAVQSKGRWKENWCYQSSTIMNQRDTTSTPTDKHTVC